MLHYTQFSRGYTKFFGYNLLFSAFYKFVSWLKCALPGLQPKFKLGGCTLSWTFVFWIFLQKVSLDALKNKESGKIVLYPVKQTVVLFIGLKSKMSVKTFDVTAEAQLW